MNESVDWVSIMPAVALQLLGEPDRKLPHEWRYRRKGSLSVRIDCGVWHDFEDDNGGGVIDLVMRELACDKSAAVAWLRDHGHLPARDRHSAPVPRSRPDPARPAASDDGREHAKAALVARLWGAGEDADDSPGRLYLARRRAWPPAGTGPDLPRAVRWLPAHSPVVRMADPAAKWHGVPDGSAGSLMFVLHRGGQPVGVQLLAVDGAGERIAWFGARAVKIRTVGRSAATFEGSPGGPLEATHVCECAVDALGVLIEPSTGPGAVLASVGAGGLRRIAHGVPGEGWVILHADGDQAGIDAAQAAEKSIRKRDPNRSVRIVPYAGDPADALAEWVGNRAAIRAYEGESADEAERHAWEDLLRARNESNG